MWVCAQFLLADSLWKWMRSSDWLLSVTTHKRSTFALKKGFSFFYAQERAKIIHCALVNSLFFRERVFCFDYFAVPWLEEKTRQIKNEETILRNISFLENYAFLKVIFFFLLQMPQIKEMPPVQCKAGHIWLQMRKFPRFLDLGKKVWRSLLSLKLANNSNWQKVE